MSTPRKQTLVILAVCVVAVAAAALYVYGKSSSGSGPAKEEPSVIAQAMNIPINAADIGTSTDWKKEFFNDNQALSGSGTFGTSSPRTAVASSSEQLTATQQFGRDFFSKYIDLQQLNMVNDPNMVSSTMASMLTQNYGNSGGPKVYSISDLNLGPSDSQVALKAYGNALGSLLQANAPAQDDATLVLNGLEGKDPSYVSELKSNVSKYENILSHMLSMPVPPSLETYHLGLINGGSAMIYIVNAFEAAESDPLRSINALRQYQDAFFQINTNIIAIRTVLTQAGITYTSGDSGSFLNINNNR